MLAGALALAACATQPVPQVVLVNAKVFTADPERPWAQALAISGDRIVAAGDSTTIAAMAGASTRRIDAGGRTVIPGLNQAGATVNLPNADAVRALVADGQANGFTSMQPFAQNRVAEAVDAWVAASPRMRATLYRSPTPQAGGDHLDSRPYFPPQPTPLLDVRGMAFEFGPGDEARLELAVGWAYATEDPLSVRLRTPQLVDAYLDALKRHGTAQVWRAKRPRLEGPVAITGPQLATVKALGVVIVQRVPGDASLESLIAAGVPVALSASVTGAFADIAWATAPARDGERVSVEEAIRLMTAGAAFAEFKEREKGTLAPGMLADLAVLSADVFTAPPEAIASIRSVMTMLGGKIVRDNGSVH